MVQEHFLQTCSSTWNFTEAEFIIQNFFDLLLEYSPSSLKIFSNDLQLSDLAISKIHMICVNQLNDKQLDHAKWVTNTAVIKLLIDINS